MIILGILLGIAIIALGVICVVQVKEHAQSNRELQKLLKSNNLQDYRVFGEEPQEEEIIEEEDLIELDQMNTVINSVNERK